MDRFHRVNLGQSLDNKNASGPIWQPTQLGRTIAVLANPMRGRISNEDHHLTCMHPPLHVQRLRQSGRDSFWPIAAARSIEPRKVPVNLANV